MNTEELLLYTEKEDSLLCKFSYIFRKDNVEKKELYYCLSNLVKFGANHGFYGNLWHCYITYIMVYNENPYSVDCEMKGNTGGTFDELAIHDFAILKELFDFDFNTLDVDFDMNLITNFSDGDNKDKVFNKRIRDCICDLSKRLEKSNDAKEFRDLVVDFYKHFGVGIIGLHKAFRLDDDGDVIPITRITHVSLDDLVGYQIQKDKLTQNTNAFVSGKKANNCLLYGDAGTGKSTSIKALANTYYDDGLRIIEVYKHQFQDLNKLISNIKNRNYRFIIYMDDLSFEEFEIEYKYLKAVIEGGLEVKPDNVLIYATSNRRHLIRETWSDRSDMSEDELHHSDTVQEKLSLVARFGVSISFSKPSKKEYENIVLTLAKGLGIDMPEEELLMKSNAWSIRNGGYSGRVAEQFIIHLQSQGKEI